MSVDLEDYFQVSAFERYISKDQWETLPSRVERNTDRILALFAENNIKATFFTLGWVAERYPGLIQRIVAEGHELACHGYSHVRVTTQSPREFRDDVKLSKDLLEGIGGVQVKGYRAASYSIGRDNFWAFQVLDELGFEYSSSIYPVRHDLYGMPEANRFSFRPKNPPNILEIPVTTVAIGGKNFPCGGGGFFRLLPYPISRWAIDRVNRVDGQPSVFYFHPWEIDPLQPRQSGIDFKTMFRHYLNLSRTESRLVQLLKDFRWDTMDKVYINHSKSNYDAL